MYKVAQAPWLADANYAASDKTFAAANDMKPYFANDNRGAAALRQQTIANQGAIRDRVNSLFSPSLNIANSSASRTLRKIDNYTTDTGLAAANKVAPNLGLKPYNPTNTGIAKRDASLRMQARGAVQDFARQRAPLAANAPQKTVTEQSLDIPSISETLRAARQSAAAQKPITTAKVPAPKPIEVHGATPSKPVPVAQAAYQKSQA